MKYYSITLSLLLIETLLRNRCSQPQEYLQVYYTILDSTTHEY